MSTSTIEASTTLMMTSETSFFLLFLSIVNLILLLYVFYIFWPTTHTDFKM